MNSGGIFDLDRKIIKLSELDEESSQAEFWNNKERSDKVIAERSAIARLIESWTTLQKKLTDVEELIELAELEDDESLNKEIEADIIKLQKTFKKLEVKAKLSNPLDKNNAIFTINPGAGGTESQDWASIILRMYLRWAEKSGFTTEIIDYQDGEEAGIKSVTVEVTGEYAFGFLKSERGIHRLVRISPFDSNKRRHTSFASLHVLPEIDEDIDIEIRDEDLKVDTYRASGAGGQHVNKTDSAIRITHIPTGTIVQCQNERSQHKNRSQAMKVLKAKLYQLELEKKSQEKDAMGGEKKDIAWGSQIRSYVLHPYKMAKDTRTKLENNDIEAVLDGDIQPFIEEYLAKYAGINE
ncbi:MAG: peptide chain release factor 2 [Nitrospinae bacterium]|nr:peptide chain release factor 2 [Nitrospinota bacterium]